MDPVSVLPILGGVVFPLIVVDNWMEVRRKGKTRLVNTDYIPSVKFLSASPEGDETASTRRPRRAATAPGAAQALPRNGE